MTSTRTPRRLPSSRPRCLLPLHHRERFQLEIDVVLARDVDDGLLDRPACEREGGRSRVVVGDGPGWVMIWPSPTFSSPTKSESVPVVGIESPSRTKLAPRIVFPGGISLVLST